MEYYHLGFKDIIRFGISQNEGPQGTLAIDIYICIYRYMYRGKKETAGVPFRITGMGMMLTNCHFKK